MINIDILFNMNALYTIKYSCDRSEDPRYS